MQIQVERRPARVRAIDVPLRNINRAGTVDCIDTLGMENTVSRSNKHLWTVRGGRVNVYM